MDIDTISNPKLEKRLRNELLEIDNLVATSKDKDGRIIYRYDNGSREGYVYFTIPYEWPFKPISFASKHTYDIDRFSPPVTSIKKILENVKVKEDILDIDIEEDILDIDIKYWSIYKHVYNLSDTKTFSQTKNFFDNNKCKILISFDGNPTETLLVRLFRSYSKIKRDYVVNYLFNGNPNIRYHICSNQNNVFFYDYHRLNSLIISLNQNKILGIWWTPEKLLELPCIWSKTRDKLEDDLIHILFGSTIECNWKSASIDTLSNVGENLTIAYKQFIDAV